MTTPEELPLWAIVEAAILDRLHRCQYDKRETAASLSISLKTLYNHLHRAGVLLGTHRGHTPLCGCQNRRSRCPVSFRSRRGMVAGETPAQTAGVPPPTPRVGLKHRAPSFATVAEPPDAA